MRTLILCLTATIALAQTSEPITSFEAGQPQPFAAGGTKVEVVAEHASDGDHALRIDVKGSAQDSWPGVYFRERVPDWSDRVLLLLDVFLAGDKPQALNLRLDDNAGHKVFDSEALQPGWNRNLGINVKALGAQADLADIQQLLLYIRIPREDVTLYLDHVRWGTFEGQFNKVVHRTPGEARRVKPPYELFARPFDQLTFLDTPGGTPVRELRCFAARGEYELVSFSLRAGKQLTGVFLEMGDLTGPDGAVIPAAMWDLARIEPLPKRFHYKSDDFLAGMPSYLAPLLSPINLPNGETRTFVMTLQAPLGAAAGVYSGTVVLIADGGRRKIPLQVRILPFHLPDPAGAFYGEYYRAFGSYVDSQLDVLRDLTDMRNFGMTSVGLCFGIDAKSCTVADGQVSFQFDGTTRFEWFMDAYRDLGFPMPVVLLSDSGQGAAARSGDYGSPEYDAAYVAFYRALADEGARHDWPGLIVQPVDEPGWQDDEKRERNAHLLKLLHQAGIPTEQDGPGDGYFHHVAGPYADLWNYNGAIGSPEQIAAAKAAGKQITLYNNDVESYRPEVDRWAYGLFNWRHGLQGGFNWEYRGGYGDLYNNLDASTGDWVHRYPRTAEHPGGPSTGFTGSREGLDDRKYLELLERLIARAPDLPEAREACVLLHDLRQRLDASPRVRSRAGFAATLSSAEARAQSYNVPDDAAKVVLGDLKQPNGLTFAEYDTIRWLVARQTMKLLAASGRGPAFEDPEPPPTWKPDERLTDVKRSGGSDLDNQSRPVTRLPILAASPTIDGVIEGDAGWSGATTLNLQLSNGAGPAEMPTAAKVGIRSDTLFVGFTCAEDRLDSIKAQVAETDGAVWQDDCVEVFIDPGVTEKKFYQVVANSRGTLLRTCNDGSVWRPEVKAAAKVDRPGNRWLVELAIPVADLNLAPRFGLNLGRERRPTEVMELSTWSVTGGPFSRPDRFGLAVIEGDLPEAPKVQPELRLAVSPGYQLLDERTTNLQIDLKLDPALLPKAKATLRVGALTVPVPGPLSERMSMTLHVGDLPAGTHDVSLTVDAPDTRRLVARTRLTRVPGAF